MNPDTSRRARTVPTKPKWDGFRIARRLIKAYLIASFLAVTLWIGNGLSMGYDMNKEGQYCDYSHPEPNWETQGIPCRLNFEYMLMLEGRGWIVALIIVHSPTYVAWLVLRFAERRRRRAAGSGSSS